MEIREQQNPTTGKTDLIIVLGAPAASTGYELPHRALVEMLLGKGMKPEDTGELIFERESD